jgi:hypothetical protein
MIDFDKSKIRIVISRQPTLVLRSAGISDLRNLLQWKNDQKNFFFHQEEITLTQQRQWYESFEKRPYDLMLMIEYDQHVFGCMGIRLQDDHWDVYNVILGLQDFGRRGLMGLAFGAMLEFALSLNPLPISLQVLKKNPAVKWYQRQGFEISEVHESHYLMIHKLTQTKKENS